MLAAVATCAFIVRMLMRQLGGEPVQVQTLAGAIAAGDLTSVVTLRRGDNTSLLASLRGMQTNLRGLVTQIKDASASVALAADEISRATVSSHPVPSSRLLRCRKPQPAWSSLLPQ